MKPICELDVISMIQSKFDGITAQSTMEGIGDDCAIIPLSHDESLLISTDMLVQGTHFLVDKITPQDLGYKALAANISDLSAMGASAFASFLSLSITPQTDILWIEQFLDGYKSLSQINGIALLGGDTVKSKNTISINITVIGRNNNHFIKRRSGAQVGDIIAVIDSLGDSAAGLRLLLEQKPTIDPTHLFLKKRHTHPPTYVAEALYLGKQPAVHAMMDLSDGLAKDLRHILQQSGKGANIHIDRIPLSKQLKEVCLDRKWKESDLSLCGGEDYSLLLTLDPLHFRTISHQFKQLFNRTLYPIGTITHHKALQWINKGVTLEEDSFYGFTH